MPDDASGSGNGGTLRLSEVGLPPYAHIPGVTPHPIRDPDGHSFQARRAGSVLPDPADWRAVPDYCAGIDLFNAGYYWEAHEAWEHVWIAAGRRGPLADFLKALIKLAAAGVKIREGAPAGAKRHLRRAVELFDVVSASPDADDGRCLGLEIAPVRQVCKGLLARPLPESPPRDGKPYCLLAIRLSPR